MTPPSHSDPKLTFAKDSEQRPGMMINSQGHVDGNSGREHWILKVQAPQQWRTTKKYLGCGQVFHSLHSLNTSNFKIVGIMCVVKAPFQTDLADRNSEHSRNFQNNLKNGNPLLSIPSVHELHLGASEWHMEKRHLLFFSSLHGWDQAG